MRELSGRRRQLTPCGPDHGNWQRGDFSSVCSSIAVINGSKKKKCLVSRIPFIRVFFVTPGLFSQDFQEL